MVGFSLAVGKRSEGPWAPLGHLWCWVNNNGLAQDMLIEFFLADRHQRNGFSKTSTYFATESAREAAAFSRKIAKSKHLWEGCIESTQFSVRGNLKQQAPFSFAKSWLYFYLVHVFLTRTETKAILQLKFCFEALKILFTF